MSDSAAGNAGAGGDSSGEPLHLGDLPGPADDETVLPADLNDRLGVVRWNEKGLVGLFSGRITQYDEQQQVVWSQTPTTKDINNVPSTIADLATTASGEVYFVGTTTVALPGEKYVGGMADIMFGKYSATGELEWRHEYGSSGTDKGSLVRVSAAGSPVFYGETDGQLPAQPSTAKGSSYALAYSPTGELVSGNQFVPPLGHINDVAIAEPSGTSYGIATAAQGNPREALSFQLTTANTLKNRVPLPASLPQQMAGGSLLAYHIVAGPIGFYTFHGYSPTCVLASWNSDGSLAWYRNSAEKHVVIDPVENVIWNGRFTSCDGIAATSDAVFIAGHYENSYENGSVTRKSKTAMFVGRYDLTGKQVWFVQLSPASGASASGDDINLLLDGNGDVIVTFDVFGELHDVDRIATLRAADGKPR